MMFKSQHAAPGGLETQLAGSSGSGIRLPEAVTLVLNREARFFRRKLGGDAHQLARVAFVPCLTA